LTPAEKVLASDPGAYDEAALSILRGDGYRNDIFYAYRPPGYSFFLAGIYVIFGHSYLVVKLVQIVLSALTGWLIYLLMKRLHAERSALLAAAFFALYPPFVKYTSLLWSETLFIFLVVAFMYFLFKSQEAFRPLAGLAAGFFLGAASLTREAAIYFLIPAAFWFLIDLPGPDRFRLFLRRFGPVLLATVVVISPWAIRNYRLFRSFIPVSTNGGINFYIGNNTQATGKYYSGYPPRTTLPAEVRGSSKEKYLALELEIQRNSYKEGLRFIRQNPGFFARLTLKKFFFFWRPPLSGLNFSRNSQESFYRLLWLIFYLAVLVLALPGLVLALKIFKKHWLLLHLWIILVTGVHIFTFVDARFQLPIIPFLMMFAAFMLDRLLPQKLTQQKAE
jgi:4-amino-4-deoxy-L-arabinose transferase-like glycosyltransferase